MRSYPKYKVAAAHVAPIFNDANRSLEKACDLLAEASRQGVRLIAFPECYLPGYPLWSRVLPPTDLEPHFRELAAGALRVDGAAVARARACDEQPATLVAVGFVELSPVNVG